MFKTTRLLTLGLLSLSTVSVASAADQWPKAYDATYESKTGPQTMQMHMYSNGKGQMRTDTVLPGGSKSISILDYPGKVCYTIMEAQKMIMKSPLKDSPKAMDTAEAKKLNATDLGSKMVNGHMAKGWSYKANAGTTEVWTDEGAQVMVKSLSKIGGTSSEMNLKTLSTNVPDDSKFKVPTSGYKTMGTN